MKAPFKVPCINGILNWVFPNLWRFIMIKNALEFRKEFVKKQPDNHFFNRENRRFFGEVAKEDKLCKEIVEHNGVKCYCYITRQHNAPGGVLSCKNFFAVDDLHFVGAE